MFTPVGAGNKHTWLCHLPLQAAAVCTTAVRNLWCILEESTPHEASGAKLKLAREVSCAAFLNEERISHPALCLSLSSSSTWYEQTEWKCSECKFMPFFNIPHPQGNKSTLTWANIHTISPTPRVIVNKIDKRVNCHKINSISYKRLRPASAWSSLNRREWKCEAQSYKRTVITHYYTYLLPTDRLHLCAIQLWWGIWIRGQLVWPLPRTTQPLSTLGVSCARLHYLKTSLSWSAVGTLSNRFCIIMAWMEFFVLIWVVLIWKVRLKLITIHSIRNVMT